MKKKLIRLIKEKWLKAFAVLWAVNAAIYLYRAVTSETLCEAADSLQVTNLSLLIAILFYGMYKKDSYKKYLEVRNEELKERIRKFYNTKFYGTDNRGTEE